MKEILFKAKCEYNKEWIEGFIKIRLTDGDLTKTIKSYYLTYYWMDKIGKVYSDTSEVIPETISQFTGLYCIKDKNSKIFENDIVEITLHSGTKYRYLVWFCQEVCEITAINIENIEFNGYDYYENRGNAMSIGEFSVMIQDHYGHIKEVKVVGNVFDNPELLKRKEN